MPAFAIAFLATLLASAPAHAQSSDSSIHVRITSVPTYEIPGVISISANRMTGRPISELTDEMIRFVRKDGEAPLSVPRPGRRVAGRAVSIDNGLLELVSDYNRDRSFIPLDAIARIERGQRQMDRSKAAEVGVATGAAVAGVTYLAALVLCGDGSNRECSALPTIFAMGPASVGALTGWMMGRTHWTPTTAEQLRTDLVRQP